MNNMILTSTSSTILFGFLISPIVLFLLFYAFYLMSKNEKNKTHKILGHFCFVFAFSLFFLIAGDLIVNFITLPMMEQSTYQADILYLRYAIKSLGAVGLIYIFIGLLLTRKKFNSKII